MRVVVSESCPIASLIVETGMFLLLAMLAHAWRATYVVSGMPSPSCSPSFFSLALTRCAAFLYCLRASFSISRIIGSR